MNVKDMTLEQQVADLTFQVRRLEGNLTELERHLDQALLDIAALRRPKDVRYVPTRLRGRS